MADIGTVTGLLKLKDEFSGALTAAGNNLKATGDKMGVVGRQMSDVGGKLTTSISLPLIAMGGFAIKAASDFETSFAGVEKTVDATAEEFDELSQGIRDLSQEIPIAVDELNAIAESAGQLGIRTENILSFTEAIANIGIATNLSTTAAAEGFARLANITGLQQTKFENLGSSIVDLGNKFAANESQILDFSLRIAAVGTVANITEPQILGIATAFTSVGARAEAGGTAVQKVLADMIEAVAEGGNSLQIFADTAGLSMDEFAAAFREDAAGAFTAFVEGLGRQGDQAFSTLNDLGLGSERVKTAFISLGNAGDLLARSIAVGTEAFEANVALAEEASVRYQTFESQLTLTWNRIKDVAIILGTALLPMLLSVLDATQPLIEGVALLAQWFADLPSPIQTTIAALVAAVAAAGPLLFIAGQLIATWGAFAAFLPTLAAGIGTVVAVIIGPVGWVVAGTALLLAWEPVREFLIDFVEGILTDLRVSIGEVVDKLQAWWDKTVEGINFLRELGLVISDDLIPIIQAFRDDLNLLIEVEVSPWIQAITDDFKLLIEVEVIPWLDVLLLKIDELASEAAEAASGVKNLVIELFNSAASFLGVDGAISSLIQKGKDWVSQTESNIFWNKELTDETGKVGDAVSDLGDGLNDLGDDLDNVAEGFDKLTVSTDIYGRAAGDVVDATELMDGVFTDTSESLDSTIEGFDLLAEAANGIERDFFETREIMLRLNRALADGKISTEQYDRAVQALSDTIDDAQRDFSGLSDTLSDVFRSGTIDLEGFGDVLGEVIDIGDNFGGSLVDAFAEIGENSQTTGGTISNAFAAASGDSQDMMIGALDAISAFASGNWLQAMMAVIGIVIGLISNLFDSGPTLEERVESFFDKWEDGEAVLEDLIDITDRLVSAFEKVLEGEFDVAKATKLLEDNFLDFLDVLEDMGEVALESFERLIISAIEAGIAGKVMKESFDDMVDVLIEMGDAGLATLSNIVAAAQASGVGLEEIAARLKETWLEAMDVLEERAQFLIDQSAQLVEGLLILFNEAGQGSARQVEFAASSIMSAFALMVEAGLPLTQILDELGEAFILIQTRGEELGLSLGDEFTRFGEMMAILADDTLRRVIERVEAMSSVVEALGNTNLLTLEQFQALGDTALNAFNRLVEGGLTANEAMAALASPLQNLLNMQEQYGFSVGASTQELLDMAQAQGIVASQGLSANDIMIRGFDSILEGLNAVIVALGGIPVAFNNWTTAATESFTATNDGMNTMTENAINSADQTTMAWKNTTDTIEQGFTDIGETSTATFEAIDESTTTTTDNIKEEWGGAVDMIESSLEDTRNAAEGHFEAVSTSAKESAESALESWLETADLLEPRIRRMAIRMAEGLQDIPVRFNVIGEEGEAGAEGGFQHGSGGFKDFGAGTQTVLHGREEVITEPQGAGVAAMVGDAIRRASGGGGGDDSRIIAVLADGFNKQLAMLKRIERAQMDTTQVTEGLTRDVTMLRARARTEREDKFASERAVCG